MTMVNMFVLSLTYLIFATVSSAFDPNLYLRKKLLGEGEFLRDYLEIRFCLYYFNLYNIFVVEISMNRSKIFCPKL